eukprot:7005193-Prymnesium_polylepis.1
MRFAKDDVVLLQFLDVRHPIRPRQPEDHLVVVNGSHRVRGQELQLCSIDEVGQGPAVFDHDGDAGVGAVELDANASHHKQEDEPEDARRARRSASGLARYVFSHAADSRRNRHAARQYIRI